MSTETTESKVTEFDDGSKIVDTVTTVSEYVPADGEIEASEVVTEAAEVAEIVDSAVEIARIEAERDITIAAIHSETETQRIEAVTESQTSWEQNIEAMRAQMEAQAEMIRSLEERLSTLTKSEQLEANQQETPQSPGSVEATPVNPETEAPESPPEPQKQRKKSRWI